MSWATCSAKWRPFRLAASVLSIGLMGRAECGRDAPGSVAFLDGRGVFARGKEAKRRTSFDPCELPQPMRALLDVVLLALQLYTWIIIASAILSWLVAFNVVNVR